MSMARRLWDRLLEWTPSARRLGWINRLCAAGLCGVAALLLWDLRQDAARQAEITSRSLIQVLGRDIARNINLYDLSLQAVADGLRRPQVMALSPEIRQMVLFGNAAAAPGFGSIFVTDRDGDLIHSSQLITEPFNCGTCEHFLYHATHDEPGLHIGPPLTSRMTGRQVVVLSRRLTNPDGSFAGVVGGAILLDYFRGLFAAVGADHAGVVTLYGANGTVIMREPYRAADIGVSVAQTSSYGKLVETRNGSFVGPAMIGTGRRNFVVSSVEGLPLSLSIAVPPEEIYAGWWWKALILGAVVLCLSAVTIVMTTLFRRELEERKRAEREMAAVNIELARLATIDALTGLSNRRRFDDVLDHEWRRTTRMGLSLSLVLLDADWFKGFNDHYGHQRGDEALKLIARAIEASIDSMTAIGCRIGGEEFALILPDTTIAAAEGIADRIHQLVAAWKLPHRSSEYGVLTVSCGVAGTPMQAGESSNDLFAAADAALYGAKLAGRNQVRRQAGRAEPGEPPTPVRAVSS